MKKLLLSLLSMLAVVGMATAGSATVTFKDLGYANQTDVETVAVNEDISLVFSKGTSSNAPKYYTTGNAVRLYGGNTLEVKGAAGVQITKAAFTLGSSNGFNKDSKATVGSFDGKTWTGDANSFTITNAGTSGHARIEKIVFTYDGGTAGGEEPKVVEVADLAAFAACASGDTRAIKSDAVAVCQLYSNLWIKDNSGWMLVYNNFGSETFENGDVIKGGYIGTLDIYNKLPELKNPENFVKGGKVAAVEPTLVNTGDADGEPVNSYIKMVGCKITGSGRNFTADDGSGAIPMYTASNNFEVPTGEGLTVYAFVSVYNTTVQLTPVEITTDSGREVVATPKFSVAAGMVDPGTTVAITCATEGATIYYTVDGTNPTAESAVYANPIAINEAMTIKALAVKEGCDDSDIATVDYTVFTPAATDAFFNFAIPSTLTPLYTEEDFKLDGNTTNYLIEVQNVAFTNKGVSVKAFTTEEGNEGTSARIYKRLVNGENEYSYRVYNKSSILFTAPETNPIVKIVFTFYNGKTSYDNLIAPEEGTWNAGEWTAPEAGVSEATFVCKGTQQIKNINVTCKNELSGVENVTVENEDAPVEYFNLQGVRVMNPENGLFIRRQGNKVSKVIIR